MKSVLEHHDGLALRRWRAGAPFELVCLPPAGGTSVQFLGLAGALGAEWAVTAVDLPGHGASAGPPVRTVAEAAERVAAAVEAVVGRPHVLLGQSLGGFVAYDVVTAYPTQAYGLVVCGTPSPTAAAFVVPTADPDLPDEAFVAELSRLGGIPERLLDVPELLRLFLPPLRADLVAYADRVATWQQGTVMPVAVPVLAVGGRDDPLVAAELLDRWVDVASACTRADLDGGHFFPQHDADAIAATMATWHQAVHPGTRSGVT